MLKPTWKILHGKSWVDCNTVDVSKGEMLKRKARIAYRVFRSVPNVVALVEANLKVIHSL